jgi:hypothetical protein
MEPAATERPDLFDIKFVRDELLYYSRDENQFLRRRRGYVIILQPELIQARFKDPDLPAQRIVLTLAVLVVVVRKLTEWLSAESLAFDFVFVADGDNQPLAQEESLLSMVFREAMANGTVRKSRAANPTEADQYMTERARRGLCYALVVGNADPPSTAGAVELTRLIVDGPRPELIGRDVPAAPDFDDAAAAWEHTLETLLAAWA